MDIIEWFGGRVSELSETNTNRARNLLLTGYRAGLLALKMPFYNKEMSPGRRLAAQTVMKVMISALAHPGDSAMVSLFVPCEPILAAGLTPYSPEAVSGYIMGMDCEKYYQERAAENGVAETMCSFHRTFLGAAQSGLLPAPPFIIYTNLACDGNMITFPYLKKLYNIPAYFIEVPYEKSEDAVRDVASQLEGMKQFVEDCSHKKISDDAIKAAVSRSRRSAESYRRYLAAESKKRLNGDVTGEMFAAFMSHLLLGSESSEKYFSMLEKEIAETPDCSAARILWLHAIPYMQPSLREMMNFTDRAFITSCDLCYDSVLTPADENEPYLSMARRMVYSGFNASPEQRIKNALETAKLTNADGAVLFAHWGCKATIGASQLIKKELEDAGLPTLVLDGDACSPANTGDGQLATRMGAFLEMLEDRK